MLYTLVLTIHNLVRWLVVVSAGVAIYRAFSGWLSKKPWVKGDERSGILYSSLMDFEVLIGVILYLFLSPLTSVGLKDFTTAMSSPVVRFFALVHVILMVLAMVSVHLARSFSKKTASDLAKHRIAAIGFAGSFVLLLAGIPWPFFEVGRPLLRLFGFIL